MANANLQTVSQQYIPKRFVITPNGGEMLYIDKYKQCSGIYLLSNRYNGYRYVGQSVNLYKRVCQHAVSGNSCATQPIVRAIRDFGFESFSVEILELCPKEALDEREILWINRLNPEYNVSIGGKGNMGYHCSEKTKRILSEHGKRQWNKKSQEERQKIIKNNLKPPPFGRKISDITKEKLRRVNTGKKLSEETKRKISLSNKGKNDNTSHFKQVAAFDDNDNLIKVYCSVKSAGRNLGVHPSSITGVLKGRRKHCCGFVWKYYNK